MHEIMLLNCPEIGMYLAFLYACVEACRAFSRMGYAVRIARSISELNNNCIVFLGDDFHVSTPADLLAKQAPRAVYIGWCWNNQDVRKLPHFVHTHQNNLKPRVPTTYLKSGSTNPVKVPFLLRANDDPALIGNIRKRLCDTTATWDKRHRRYIMSPPVGVPRQKLPWRGWQRQKQQQRPEQQQQRQQPWHGWQPCWHWQPWKQLPRQLWRRI